MKTVIREMDSSLYVPLDVLAGVENPLVGVAVLENKSRYLTKVVSFYTAEIIYVVINVQLSPRSSFVL